jgi:hypothetical protein
VHACLPWQKGQVSEYLVVRIPFSGRAGTTTVRFPVPPQKEHFLVPLQYIHTPFLVVQKGHSCSSYRFARFSLRAQESKEAIGSVAKK